MTLNSLMMWFVILVGPLTSGAVSFAVPMPQEKSAGTGNASVDEDATAPVPTEPQQSEAGKTASEPPDWVEKYLAKDKLAGQDLVTLDDLRAALQDPEQQARVIANHFQRVQGATDAQKRNFLTEALQHPSLPVRQQAAKELESARQLESVVVDQLTEFLKTGDSVLKEAVIIALEHLQFDATRMPDEFWEELAADLASDNEQRRSAAGEHMEAIGVAAVPLLLDALKNPQREVAEEAARRLSRIVGTRPETRRTIQKDFPFPSGVAPEVGVPGAVVTAKAGRDVRAAHLIRQADQSEPTSVRVFYGTNREIVPDNMPRSTSILPYSAAILALVLLQILHYWHIGPANPWGCRSVISILLLIGIGAWTALQVLSEFNARNKMGTGTHFGFRRDTGEQVHYGYCDVSIPPSHQAGEVESPLFGREDDNQHVVLKKTEILEDAAFFETVRQEIAKRDPDLQSCFVFIHGFNVSFEDAARRTAQIHFDLKFQGAPVFFSWPSRNSVRHYFSDRNEIGFSQFVIKQFLLDVAERVDAKRIHVIAHSMGADATCRAIADLGDRGKIFDQIILAAPDIDREVFRLQLAPRLTQTSQRTTLYCSQNDFALQVSNKFNDGLRAGDSSRGVLTTAGVDTIDATQIDTDLLGHSYYGDCLQILNDVRELITSNLEPERRQLIAWPVSENDRYWTFAEPKKARPARPREATGSEKTIEESVPSPAETLIPQ